MPYLPRNTNNNSNFVAFKRRPSRFWKILVATVLAILFLVGLSFAAPHLFSGPLQILAQPFVAVRNTLSNGITAIFAQLESKASLEASNTALIKQNTFFNLVVEERDYYQNQDAHLETILGEIASSSNAKLASAGGSLIAAGIISKPGFSPYDSMVIAAGTNEGIQAGDIVLADTATTIGSVSSVSADTATVVAFSSPGQTTNVLIGSSSVEVAANGLGGGTLEVHLPRTTDVSVGDIVTLAATPVAHSHTPAKNPLNTLGDIIGRVSVATATPAEPFQDVLFTSPVNINELSTVLIKIK
jgi:cell shape-determining protein MreC